MWTASSAAPARFTSIRTASVSAGKYVGSAWISTRSPGAVRSASWTISCATRVQSVW